MIELGDIADKLCEDRCRLFEIRQNSNDWRISIHDKEDGTKPELGNVVVDTYGLKEYLKTFGSYIESVIVDCKALSNCDGLFAYCYNMEYLEFTDKWAPQPGVSTNVFVAGCSKLKQIVCKAWDLSKWVDRLYLFECDAKPLVTIPFGNDFITGTWIELHNKLPIVCNNEAGGFVMSLMRSGRLGPSTETKTTIKKLIDERRSKENDNA